MERVASQFTTPPERIHGWQHTQMSIAQFSGGIKYNGHGYTIVYTEKGHPLVRDDVLRREAKAAKEAVRSYRP